MCVTRAALRHLDEIADLEALPEVVIDRMRRRLGHRLDISRDHPGDDLPRQSADTVYRDLRRDLIAVETAELQRLHATHRISDTTRRRLQRRLDLEEAGLGDP